MTRAAGALAGHLRSQGVGRGDVVMTLIGNRPEWVLAMLACTRIGAIVLPCNEQLRAKNLRLRIAVSRPAVIIVDARDLDELQAAVPACPLLVVPDPHVWQGPAPAYAELDPEDEYLLTFTSGTEGEPKGVLHTHRYLAGQDLQARHWLGVRPGDVVWCTAASGWASRHATRSSRPGCEGRRRSCTTGASIQPSGWRSCSAKASTSCAWPRPSTK